MYIQDSLDRFVLNPKGDNDLGSYETEDGVIKLLVQNKKYLNAILKRFFTKSSATFLRKVGPWNQYTVQLNGPILDYSPDCVVTDDPDPSECMLFDLVVSSRELTDRDYRSKLLSCWILESANPTQFNKLLKANFTVVDLGNGSVRITKNIINDKADPTSI